ncbi:putative alpha,alpha-trehalose-phosphate synthase [UDP-forming] 9 [Gossypium australe]|uniref:Putative alpha,alpha-trehalose-phosphate synthase [UDP-forming] 9 n=1 Tax=Gossypium australe TaxID=47621 RepID=A0A5B6WG03_9ROSI|nr:putative alpha,alpha-trehalose-phosphate synthase [UDP-forming] 9 [Gossypium australe]
MIGAFQCIAGVNHAAANRGLLLECLRTLGGKEFKGVKRADLTIVEYWLEGVEMILEQMACTNEKLGYIVSLLDGEAHRWWSMVQRSTTADRVTWDFFLETFRKKYMDSRKRVYLVAYNTEHFDELVVMAKVVEETLIKASRSRISESGKRFSMYLKRSRQQPKRGQSFLRSGGVVRQDTRSSQPRR